MDKVFIPSTYVGTYASGNEVLVLVRGRGFILEFGEDEDDICIEIVEPSNLVDLFIDSVSYLYKNNLELSTKIRELEGINRDNEVRLCKLTQLHAELQNKLNSRPTPSDRAVDFYEELYYALDETGYFYLYEDKHEAFRELDKYIRGFNKYE